MDQITEDMMDAFDKLFEECGCSGDKNTTNVMGNIVRRAANEMSNDKKAALGKKAVRKSTV